MIAITHIEIEHHPRFQRITVTRPSGEVNFRIEALPSIALLALSDFLRRWAES